MRKWLLFLRALFSPSGKLNEPLAKITNDIYIKLMKKHH